MRGLLWVAVVLIAIWIIVRIVVGIAGALLNLLWIVALVLLVLWLIGKLRGGTSGPTDTAA